MPREPVILAYKGHTGLPLSIIEAWGRGVKRYQRRACILSAQEPRRCRPCRV